MEFVDRMEFNIDAVPMGESGFGDAKALIAERLIEGLPFVVATSVQEVPESASLQWTRRNANHHRICCLFI